MKRLVPLMALCLLLTGCSWMDGNYHSVTPHEEHIRHEETETVSASNYLQLRSALENMICTASERGVINVADFTQGSIEDSISIAVSYVQNMFPLGAYAVDTIDYEIGIGGGKPAIAVNIQYLRSAADIQKIRTLDTMEQVEQQVGESLDLFRADIVMQVENYEPADFTQIVEDYALMHPDRVMEMPQVSANVFPESGRSRVIELRFDYQNSRAELKNMQEEVQRVFSSAELYISSEDADSRKYAQLYAFLMERFDYQYNTSITPAYSLLRHGVGDSRAFAVVYAAICRQCGLNCQVVTGTRDGESWSWNIVWQNGQPFYVDLLRSAASGGFQVFTDGDMQDYVWDYSAYPQVTVNVPPQEQTEEYGTEPTEVPAENEK